MIDVASVTVDIGETMILEDVSLSIDSGHLLGLVGPNGAGKTTLLRTCNGILAPTTGHVALAGDTVATLSAREVAQRVATVPQESALAFDFDVADVVAMGRTPHRSRFQPTSTADEAAVTKAMDRTDTTRFADRPVGSLSGGERQRVMVARALAQETPVLLLDEPTASLDINHQVRTLSLARTLADEGKTVVAAIHDLELAARYCDTMAMLADGRLLAAGSPDQVLTAERIEKAFDVRAAVASNPVTGTRTVTPVADTPSEGPHVHVLGGGSRAARVIGRLVDAGLEVTVGVLPAGDVASATAQSVAREVVSAPPFEAVPAAQRERVRELVAAADVTLVADSLTGVNRAVARECEDLVAVEGSDVPSQARVIGEGEVLATITSEPGVRPQESSS